MGSQRRAELSREVFQGLGNNRGTTNYWHEIRVPIPARHDMHMQVVQDASSGYLAQVHTDVESFGTHDGGKGVLTAARQVHQVSQFTLCELIQVTNLAIGHHHEVSARVGIGVEQRIAGALTCDHMILLVFIRLADLEKEAVLPDRFGRQDVLDPPWGVQDLHYSNVVRPAMKVKRAVLGCPAGPVWGEPSDLRTECGIFAFL